jgi:hypothetical protein
MSDRALRIRSGNGNLRTLSRSKNHPTKIKRSKIRLQLVLRENWLTGDPLLCGRSSAFPMRCLRTLFHEETALLSIHKFPIPELPQFAFDYCSLVPPPEIKNKTAYNVPHVLKRRSHMPLAGHQSGRSSITACKKMLHRFKRKKWLVLIRPPTE